MTTRNEFGQELLKVNGIEPDGISSEDRQALHRILARDKARARRMKWATVATWVLVLGAVAGHLVTKVISEKNPGFHTLTVVLACIMLILFYLALFFTGSYGIRAWIARNRASQVRMTEMELRLASIDDRLKRISEGR
jgi:hypothetical protein